MAANITTTTISSSSTLFNQVLFIKYALFKVNEHRKTLPITYMKPGQFKSITNVIYSDVISILPTGYGKSLIFEALPHFAAVNGFQDVGILLISPLNAIIDEQLARLGSKAERIVDGTLPSSRVKDGDVTFVVGHPEEMLSQQSLFMKDCWQKKHMFIVVDEAHCVVQWGEGFRPAYMNIKQLRAIFPNCRMLALTATAGMRMTRDIVSGLNMMSDIIVVRKNIDRSNIKLIVEKRPPNSGGNNTVQASYDHVFSPIISELKQSGEHFPKTVVYCNLKWCGYAHNLALSPDFKGQPSPIRPGQVAQFHAPLKSQTKAKIVKDMQLEGGELRLLLATQAYSMGVDAPDIRRVIHAGSPRCMETYIQEVGRAGRDHNPAIAKLFYNASDIAGNVPGMTDEMRAYCKLTTCRREYLCSLFDSQVDRQGLSNFDCCDICELSL